MSDKVTLIPIAMVTPTKDFIYAPSRIRPSVEVNGDECTQVQDIPISFEANGKSNAIPTATYIKNGDPMQGRFIKR